MREADLEGHFTQGDVNPDTSSDDATEPEAEEPDDASQQEGKDLQLERAVEVLKSWTYFDHLRKDQPTPSMQAKAAETAP
jgi:hypothetical protein